MVMVDATPLPWGDVATWVTGLATVALFLATFALFVVGYIQIRTEREIRMKREMESARMARRKQAEHISCWVAGADFSRGLVQEQDLIWVAVLNESSQPVYQVILSMYGVHFGIKHDAAPHWSIDPPGSQECISVAPPGRGYVALSWPGGGMNREPGVEIAFQDASGNNWVRTPWGDLMEIETPTAEYYGIYLPINSTILEPDLPPEANMWRAAPRHAPPPREPDEFIEGE